MCDENNDCVCSASGLDIPDSVKDILGGLDIFEWVKQKIGEFQKGVDDWEITQEVKALVPSRCRLGDG